MILKEIDAGKFDSFVRNDEKKSHFLQSKAWGEIAEKGKGLTPFYLGLFDDEGNIKAATLLLQKKLPLGMCHLYAPRGYMIDFYDEELLATFTEEIVKFAKAKKAIYVKIDPDIIWQRTGYDGEVIEEEKKEQKAMGSLKKLGYKHLGFTKNFETAQPRYTFRVDLNQSMEDIEKHFSKTTKQRIKKSLKLDTSVRIGDENDIEDFYRLMLLTEDRKDFVSFSLEYYQTLYSLFKETDDVFLFLGSANIKRIEEILTSEKNELEVDYEKQREKTSKSAVNKQKELTKRIEKIENDLQKYAEVKKEYGEELLLSAHMIVTYGDKAWVLFAGNHNLLSQTYTNYHTYYEHLKFCKEKGIRIYDQFGTTGDLSKDNPRFGLYEFKKKFGGDYIEFMGEFDYVIKPLAYFGFTKLVPIYRKHILAKKKKELKKEAGEK